MNVISRIACGLLIAAAVPALAGAAPYENATSKAAPRMVAPRARYVQPRMYAQPTIVAQPRVATAAPSEEMRRTFSFEPAAPVMAAPAYASPRAGVYRQQHTYENATMKGLGQIR